MTIEIAIEKVRDYLKEQGREKNIAIDDELDLIESGILDSLQIMALVIVIEKIRQKPIAIEDLSMEHLRSITLIQKNFFHAA